MSHRVHLYHYYLKKQVGVKMVRLDEYERI